MTEVHDVGGRSGQAGPDRSRQAGHDDGNACAICSAG